MCEMTFDRGDVVVPDGLEATIARKVAWLESAYPELRQCRVTLSGPVPDRRHAPYRFRLALQARGLNMLVCGHPDTQLRAALSSALDVAQQKLADDLHRRHG